MTRSILRHHPGVFKGLRSRPAGPAFVFSHPLNVVYLNALANDDQKHFFVTGFPSERGLHRSAIA
jgi:hypothetical protein